MSYSVQLLPQAEKDLKKIDKPQRQAIEKKLKDLARDPRHDAKPLKEDPDTWSRRAGDYRILYQIHENKVVVLVIRIGHRREVYR